MRDDPSARLALAARTYHGPTGRAPRHLPFRRAAMSFMRWQAARGVLAPLDAELPGSPWWRAVNERLLRDGCEVVARAGGLCGEPSSSTVDRWLAFVGSPTARSWYGAHDSVPAPGAAGPAAESVTPHRGAGSDHDNASIAAAYVEHRDLAERDPRLGMAGAFLSLGRVLPDRYPLDGAVETYLADEHGLGRLLDYGVIGPRLQRLYEWSAEALAEPGLRELIRDGSPVYAWPYDERHVWAGRPSVLGRVLTRVTRPSR